jgi:hypothetical protein
VIAVTVVPSSAHNAGVVILAVRFIIPGREL